MSEINPKTNKPSHNYTSQVNINKYILSEKPESKYLVDEKNSARDYTINYSNLNKTEKRINSLQNTEKNDKKKSIQSLLFSENKSAIENSFKDDENLLQDLYDTNGLSDQSSLMSSRSKTSPSKPKITLNNEKVLPEEKNYNLLMENIEYKKKIEFLEKQVLMQKEENKKNTDGIIEYRKQLYENQQQLSNVINRLNELEGDYASSIESNKTLQNLMTSLLDRIEKLTVFNLDINHKIEYMSNKQNEFLEILNKRDSYKKNEYTFGDYN